MTSRLLLVEDDDNVRTVLNRALGDLGYDVDAQSSYHAGARAAQAQSPDILLTDTVLIDPAFNHKIFYGFDLARRLRRDDTMVIIGMSGSDASEVLPGQQVSVGELYDQAGADAFLSKPFPISELERVIKDALAKRKK